MIKSDFEKRRDLFAEFLYYLFDSFLIPLLRGHFYVTESGVSGSQLFFFRHDVWKAISEPALNSMKTTMLEACNIVETRAKLAKQQQTTSKVRLVPKDNST